MLEAIRKKRNQRSPVRRNVDDRAVGHVQAERATVIGAPALVEIEHDGQHAGVVVAKTVDVPRIGGAGRIERVVTVELEQAELQLAIRGDAQRRERRPRNPLRRRATVVGQPGNAVAADVRAFDAAGSAPDARRSQLAVALERKCARPQVGHDSTGKEIGNNGEALPRDLLDDGVDA